MRNLTILFALLIALPAAAPAAAAPTVEPGTPVYVRFPAVLAAFRKTKSFQGHQSRLRDEVQRMEAELRILSPVRFGSQEQRQEAIILASRPMLDEAGKKRIEALVAAVAAMDTEYKTLSQKADASPADQKRLAELSDFRKTGAEWYDGQRDERQKRIGELDAEIRGSMSKEITRIIGVLAGEMGLKVVYDQSAILWGGFDLSDEVIKKLPN